MPIDAGQRVHFVGVGGVGLSAIARVLLERGVRVSGSDRGAPNALTQALIRDGARVYQGHDAAHLRADEADGALPDLLIVSSAVGDANPEVQAARAAGVPVYRRRQIMAEVLAGRRVAAVAGTHGKTTTTAMTVHLMRALGYAPGYIVGGILADTGTNGAHGAPDAPFAIEADEYDDMFLGLRPTTAALTSAEYDHPDYFPDEAALHDSFRRFIALLPTDGALVAWTDSAAVRALADGAACRVIRVGFGDAAHIRVGDLRSDSNGTHFSVSGSASLSGPLTLRLPGVHNVQNALTALALTQAAADAQGLAFDGARARAALASFQGTGRRFEVLGQAEGLTVISDYAHHPTAIRVTLDAARRRYPDAVVWALWQPHTFSRTAALLNDYAAAFDDADRVFVTDIYPAREAAPAGESVGSVAAAVAARIAHPQAVHSGDLAASAARIHADLSPVSHRPIVLVIMSAGDAPQIGARVLEERGAR